MQVSQPTVSAPTLGSSPPSARARGSDAGCASARGPIPEAYARPSVPSDLDRHRADRSVRKPIPGAPRIDLVVIDLSRRRYRSTTLACSLSPPMPPRCCPVRSTRHTRAMHPISFDIDPSGLDELMTEIANCKGRRLLRHAEGPTWEKSCPELGRKDGHSCKETTWPIDMVSGCAQLGTRPCASIPSASVPERRVDRIVRSAPNAAEH